MKQTRQQKKASRTVMQGDKSTSQNTGAVPVIKPKNPALEKREAPQGGLGKC